MPPSSFDPVVERELLGICKQSMLQLGQQLRQYVDQLHKRYSEEDVTPVMVKAMNEYALAQHSTVNDFNGISESPESLANTDPTTTTVDVLQHPPSPCIVPAVRSVQNTVDVKIEPSTEPANAIPVINSDWLGVDVTSGLDSPTSSVNAYGIISQVDDMDQPCTSSGILHERGNQYRAKTKRKAMRNLLQPLPGNNLDVMGEHSLPAYPSDFTINGFAADTDIWGAIPTSSTNAESSPYKCPSCKKTFKTQCSLAMHIRNQHQRKHESFPCAYCEKVFTQNGTRLRHERFFHDHLATRKQCPYPGCSYSSIRSDYIRSHMKTHRKEDAARFSDLYSTSNGMSPSTFDLVVERELLGICKQSMLQLGQQLRQYVDQLHNQYNKHDVTPVMIKAINEVDEHTYFHQNPALTLSSTLTGISVTKALSQADGRLDHQSPRPGASYHQTSSMPPYVMTIDGDDAAQSFCSSQHQSNANNGSEFATATAGLDVGRDIKFEPSTSTTQSLSGQQQRLSTGVTEWSDLSFVSYHQTSESDTTAANIYGGIAMDAMEGAIQQPGTSSDTGVTPILSAVKRKNVRQKQHDALAIDGPPGSNVFHSLNMDNSNGGGIATTIESGIVPLPSMSDCTTEERYFSCNGCAKRFQLKESLLRHIKQSHSGTKLSFPCAKCTRVFTHIENRRRHIKIFHNPNPKMHSCPHCEYVSPRIDSLKKHQMVNHRNLMSPQP